MTIFERVLGGNIFFDFWKQVQQYLFSEKKLIYSSFSRAVSRLTKQFKIVQNGLFCKSAPYQIRVGDLNETRIRINIIRIRTAVQDLYRSGKTGLSKLGAEMRTPTLSTRSESHVIKVQEQ